jgi:proteasome lid subunit RPN8/RPN11
MSDKKIVTESSSAVEFDSSVLQQIRRHARTSMTAEICGVLIGKIANGVTRVEGSIAGENAKEGGAHVTFTQETWQHIYKIKDAKFADASIVGWYHSHPGFGIFLSDYDLFIHKNFFAAPHQVAWVFDPHSDEEGCFGWVSGEIAPVKRISVLRRPSDSLPKAAEVPPDLTSTHKPYVPSKKIPRLRIFTVGKWLSCALIILILLLVYRQMAHHETKITTSQSAAPRQQHNDLALKSARDAPSVIPVRLFPRANEIANRYGKLLRVTGMRLNPVETNGEIVKCVITYFWTSPDQHSGFTTYEYVYDFQAHKLLDTRRVSSNSKNDEELFNLAKTMGKQLFKEK